MNNEELRKLRDECDERYRAFDAGDTKSEHYLIAAAYAWLSCELTALLDKAAAPGPTPLEFKLAQATDLLDMFGGDETLITVEQHDGKLFAYATEYPDEGSIVLGEMPAPADKRRAPASLSVLANLRSVADRLAMNLRDAYVWRPEQFHKEGFEQLMAEWKEAARLAVIEEAKQAEDYDVVKERIYTDALARIQEASPDELDDDTLHAIREELYRAAQPNRTDVSAEEQP